jgi:hypothetical protein
MFTSTGLRELIKTRGFVLLKQDQMPYRMPLPYLLAKPENGLKKGVPA